MKKITSLAIICVLVLGTLAFAAEKTAAPANFYEWFVHYLRQANERMPAPLEIQDQLVVGVIDTLLSALCLYLTLWMCTGTRSILFKKYFWFLVIFNLAWLVMLVVFKGCWEALDFLVIKLQPDLKDTVWNHFALAVVISPIVLYVWLIARTFSLKFYASLATFLISHALYLLIIYLFVSFVPTAEEGGFTLIKQNLGLTPMAQSYLLDINRITARQPFINLLRVRPFHL